MIGLFLAYLIWTFWPGTIRAIGHDPRILVGSVYVGPGLGIIGQVAYAEGCIYAIWLHAGTREVLGQYDAAWPVWSRPVVVDGVPGVRVGREVFLVGDVFISGGGPGDPLPIHDPPPRCRPGSRSLGFVTDPRHHEP